jgi:hypothetical protein
MEGSAEIIICPACGQDNALIMGLSWHANDRVGERSAAFRRGAVFHGPGEVATFDCIVDYDLAGVGNPIGVE